MVDLVIVGGGASGLVAAIVAAREGAKVTILERTDRVGKKILATGNGRCNITNIDCNIRNYHGSNPKFALGALTGFDPGMTIQFFEELGIAHKVESGGKVFPLSDQASSILDVLRMEIDKLPIDILLDKEVGEIRRNNRGFKVSCLDSTSYYGDKIIVATGGKASPSLGSNGSGLSLLKKMGHKVISPFPSLAQIILDTKVVRRIQGVKFQGKVTVSDGSNKREELGEILFTKDGISGPPVLQVSRLVSKSKQRGSRSSVSLDLFPGYTLEELEVIIQMRRAYQPKRSLQDFLVGFINKRLIPELLRESGLNDMKRLSSSLTIKEVNKLAQTFKDWKFTSTGTRPWNSAQVMAGGISTKEVYQDTLQSKKIPGLYIVGELLDIDGDCGGFNLQWAWSSAYMAAIDAASNNK